MQAESQLCDDRAFVLPLTHHAPRAVDSAALGRKSLTSWSQISTATMMLVTEKRRSRSHAAVWRNFRREAFQQN